MKRIISLLLSIGLLSCFMNFVAFADELEVEDVNDYFNTDIQIKIDEGNYEIGKSAKFRIDFPQFQNEEGDFLFANDTIYYNVFLQVVSVSDTNGILHFGRTVDSTYTFYEGYFAPKDSGETQLVVEFRTCGFNEFGEEIEVEGEGWRFTITGDLIDVEDIEVESGYFENSSEETFDIDEYYKQENAEKLSSTLANAESSVNSNQGNNTKNKVWPIILAVILVGVILAATIFFGNNIKKNKK